MGVRRFRWGCSLCAVLGATFCIAPAYGEDAKVDEWRFGIAPYVWLPTINGNFQLNAPAFSRPGGGGVPGGGILGEREVSISNEIGPSDYLTHLNFALMVAGSAQKGPWSMQADLVYLTLTSETSNVRGVDAGAGRIPIGLDANLGTETDLKANMLTLLGGYQVLGGERAEGSLLLGVRHVDVEADLDWNLQFDVTGTNFVLARHGSVSRDAGLTDALVGFRGRIWFDDASRWSLPFYFDAGAGSSDLTWQAMIGVAYAYSQSELLIMYRHLDYQGGEAEDLVQDLEVSGIAVGWAFRF